MHTFSPAKMWIGGLKHLSKPLAHLHTQFNTEIPWDSIDMDYMNLHQAAHGDREMGFMMSRMGKQRKVIVGHWKEQRVLAQIDVWGRVAAGWHEMQHMKVARIGDNMREVAVTEGDKVAAQLQFGFSVNGYGLGDVVKHVNDIQDTEVDQLVNEYCGIYEISNNLASSESLRDAARIELGLKQFLEAGKFKAFTTTFENLHGLKQLPGISAQRLMEAGYGFGAEGDWKTAALLRAVKVMDEGLVGGTSFMEDYTYNFLSKHSTVLGSHMLEICPSIANGKPKCEIHPLSIGGKEDPVRLVFDVDGGKGINASLIDMGNRFRMVLNEVDVVKTENQLPKLPVARVLWEPMPDLATAAEAWLLAGGAHHTVFSKAIGTEYFEDFCDIAGIELLIIDEETRLRNFRNEIRWNDVYYQIKN
jgi:L-arabinose isomerase